VGFLGGGGGIWGGEKGAVDGHPANSTFLGGRVGAAFSNGGDFGGFVGKGQKKTFWGDHNKTNFKKKGGSAGNCWRFARPTQVLTLGFVWGRVFFFAGGGFVFSFLRFLFGAKNKRGGLPAHGHQKKPPKRGGFGALGKGALLNEGGGNCFFIFIPPFFNKKNKPGFCRGGGPFSIGGRWGGTVRK